MMYNIMLYYLSLSCICAVVSLSYLNPENAVIEEVWVHPIADDDSSNPVSAVGVNEGRLINPFANATSGSCPNNNCKILCF